MIYYDDSKVTFFLNSSVFEAIRKNNVISLKIIKKIKWIKFKNDIYMEVYLLNNLHKNQYIGK